MNAKKLADAIFDLAEREGGLSKNSLEELLQNEIDGLLQNEIDGLWRGIENKLALAVEPVPVRPKHENHIVLEPGAKNNWFASNDRACTTQHFFTSEGRDKYIEWIKSKQDQ